MRSLEEIIADNKAKLAILADQFGWEIDDSGEPHEPAREFAAWDYPTMAHIAVAAGMFSSVKEAKRNGWNRPPTPGRYTIGRKKFVVL